MDEAEAGNRAEGSGAKRRCPDEDSGGETRSERAQRAAAESEGERSETEAEPALWSSRRRLLKCCYLMLISKHDVVGDQENEFHRHRHC